MVALRSFRHSGPSFADLVPYAGLVDDGIVARAENGWAIADLDLGAFDANAQRAQVANARDWPAQLRPGVQCARVERL